MTRVFLFFKLLGKKKSLGSLVTVVGVGGYWGSLGKKKRSFFNNILNRI
jgi:hypothetical protein